MTTPGHAAGDRKIVVGRLRKPHGLKGDCSVFPLTDEPEIVFAVGRSVWLTGLDGTDIAGPLEIVRSRGYHREWLITFRGHSTRESMEGWTDVLISAPESELRKPGPDEVYLHELEGFSVRAADGSVLGVVSGVYELPAGLTIEVQGPKREFLLPFRKEFVRQVERERRQLIVELPDGFLDIA